MRLPSNFICSTIIQLPVSLLWPLYPHYVLLFPESEMASQSMRRHGPRLAASSPANRRHGIVLHATKGKCWLVGSGPGNSLELMTVCAAPYSQGIFAWNAQ